MDRASDIWSPLELQKLPTLATGQCCSLKVDDGTRRVWICRVSGGVTVERLINGRWEKVAGDCHDGSGDDDA